jgi:hypothetical protein
MGDRAVKIWIVVVTLAWGFVVGGGVARGQITIDPLPHSAVLRPTTNAPADASGLAWVEFPPSAVDVVGIDSNLHVRTVGLSGGVYTVSISDDASNTYVVGTLTSPSFTNIAFADSAVPLSTAGTITTGPNQPAPPIAIPVGEGTFSLPDGVGVTNLVGISVADSNAVVDLVGSFVVPTNVVHHEFREDVLLGATNDAPAGATGRAELDENNDDGTNVAMVTVEAEGLLSGTYTVDLTDETGTNTFALGDLDVSVHTNWPTAAASLFRIFGRTNTSGRTEFPLPSGLDASNAVTISVVNSNLVTELVGDFANPTNTLHCGFTTSTPVIGGPICPNLRGMAGLDIQVVRGHSHDKFSLVAQGAPANKKLTLLVNGVSVGEVKSTKRGQITIKRLPKTIDLMDVMAVEADDADGNVVFSASF